MRTNHAKADAQSRPVAIHVAERGRPTGKGAVPGRAIPTAWTIRPQFGSPPYSAVLTSGEFATARAAACTERSSPP